MKLLLSTALLAVQCCQVVHATDNHADNLTSRVSKTLTKQFKTISSVMEKHPVNVKSIHALQKKRKNFQSLHRNLDQDFEGTQCEMDLYNFYESGDYDVLYEIFDDGVTLLPDFITWDGDETAITDACTDLGGFIVYLNENEVGEDCEDIWPMLHFPECIPNSCTVEEFLQLINNPPPLEDDYFNYDDDGGDRRLEDYEVDDWDFDFDCSNVYELSEGPPEIDDSCLTHIYTMLLNNFDLLITRAIYSFYAEYGDVDDSFDFFGSDIEEALTNFTATCEDSDASVYFTKSETNGQCFTEDIYGYQVEAEGWDALPECIPNEKCTQEEALEAYQTFYYNMQFESQPDCVFELEYTFPPDDETPEESPPSPPSPDVPSSKAPKSMKSFKSTKSSKAPKMVKMPKMPKMPKMVKMMKAAKDEYKGLRSSLTH
ncbi:predicted protein [Chaetoceros tenuissimus]|uniref:Uncharacterized protein n=1 Tax=Chaetoceros tenuissimus TaxID=426638 RepID=A0AAD3D3A4_9STRA|nr:predicted protein [Chaetoceros tenuissimus]